MFGTLIELFDCRKELYTATEVVANQSLFHVVVSSWPVTSAATLPHRMHCADLDTLYCKLPATLPCLLRYPLPPPSTHPSTRPTTHPFTHPPHAQVADDTTALRLSQELTRGKCGRVSFMPLNQLKPGEVQYPEQVGTKCFVFCNWFVYI